MTGNVTLNANTDGKKPTKVTKESLEELGERLYTKINEIVIPEWTEAFHQLTLHKVFVVWIFEIYNGRIITIAIVNRYNKAAKIVFISVRSYEARGI